MKGVLNFKVRELASGKGSICVTYSFGRGTEVVLSTGKQVKSISSWNDRKQRVKNVTTEPHTHLTNQFLHQLYSDLENNLTLLANKNPKFSKENVKAVIRKTLGKPKKEDIVTATSNEITPSLRETYEWYIKYFEKNPTTTTKKPLSPTTIKTFKSTKRKLFEYFEKTREHNFEDIDMNFYEVFVEWLRTQNYSDNYIGNHIKNLKTVLNYALSRGYHNNLVFKKPEFAKPKEQVDSIYLNEEELESLYKLKLEKPQSISRDLFLIGAYTGLRVSDFNNLKKENIITINDSKFIQVVAKKTNQRLTIPCNSKVIKILDKYGGNPPPKRADQLINKDLKKIGAKAELKEVIKIKKTVGGKSKEVPYFKYDLLKTHTARKSFCTNAYKAGMQTFDIMSISGHTTEKQFYEYIRATNQEKATRLAGHAFFK
ncbi:hypothetical protein A9Q93_12910 [Nonlabens dokdonensis]|uniref:Integrase n=1 Tax=Nonlabens dokdonensis TaxID=328515 RepID=A0A1Z8AJZ2_9FLAO|nr:tyrosine-type recombinase/integrase [Nonlabens dokdonensis]OUS10448.1 hypothetical protein A9Q93_12910 [Nonlabens dokdonensis]